MRRFIFILLSLVFMFSFDMWGQEADHESFKYNDGPYIFRLNNIYNAFWVRDGQLIEELLIPAAFNDVKKNFDLPFDYKDMNKVFKRRTRFRQSYRNVDSICVISDVHGRYDRYTDLLKAVQVVDNELKWDFGKGHLVILGDIFDRGDQVTEILWHVFSLEKQAEKAGGKVHVLFGNHEQMVLNYELGYIADKYRKTETTANISYTELFSENSVLGNWLRKKPVAVTINNILFVHAGISPLVVIKGFTVKKMNRMFYREVLGKDPEVVLRDENLSLLISDQGPLWYRGYFSRAGIDEEIIDGILSFYGVEHIVVGHTPGERIRSFHNNKILGIDAGIANGLPGEALLIRRDEFIRVNNEGRQSKLTVKNK
ncbi:MAG TPA: metallophosphoesterase [Bacteroidales bacterium]|nr:metallophosphoesterase [Bacteroidales bacterium]